MTVHQLIIQNMDPPGFFLPSSISLASFTLAAMKELPPMQAHTWTRSKIASDPSKYCIYNTSLQALTAFAGAHKDEE